MKQRFLLALVCLWHPDWLKHKIACVMSNHGQMWPVMSKGKGLKQMTDNFEDMANASLSYISY